MTTTTPLVISKHLEWIFDDSPIPDPHGKGERAVQFLRALRHPKSSLPGRQFQLDRWQERIIRRIYGDTLPDGSRRIKTVFALIPRGNRKTTLGAAMCMIHLGPERIPGSQVQSAAVDRDQARIAFEEMTGVIGAHPRLAEAFQIQSTNDKSRITHRKSGAFYRAMSADGGTAHGRTPAFVLVDELHAWKKRDLWEALRSSLIKATGSLLAITTTAGIGRENIAWDRYSYAKSIALGEFEDETFLPILFESDKDDDWRDEDVWRRVNPGLSCTPPYPDIVGMRQLAREADRSPAERSMFEQLILNRWQDGAANPEWSLDIWDECGGGFDLEQLRGSRAWLAVDLSKRIDLSAVATAIEMDDGKFALHVQSFTPEKQLRKRADNDGAPYPLWRDQGFLTVCDGDIVNYDVIEEHIRKMAEMFQVEEVNFDPYMARDMVESLEGSGIPINLFEQGIRNFAKPVVDFEDAMMNRRLVHDGNPLLRWAISNTVMQRDANENRKPNKDRSADRIDPAVASIIAIGRAYANASGRSSYDDAPDDLSLYVV
jgi:phage terminase large subunit-like protein